MCLNSDWTLKTGSPQACWSLIVHVVLQWISDEECRGLSNGSLIRHIGLRWVSDRSPMIIIIMETQFIKRRKIVFFFTDKTLLLLTKIEMFLKISYSYPHILSCKITFNFSWLYKVQECWFSFYLELGDYLLYKE